MVFSKIQKKYVGGSGRSRWSFVFGIWLKYKDKDVGIIVKEIMQAIKYEIATHCFRSVRNDKYK